MFKGIKAFLLSVLTIGSLVATGNMAKSQETEVAEAATVNVTFEVDFTVVNNWNPNSDSDITDYRLHTDADVDYGCWDKTSENLSGTTNKNIKTRKLNISKGTNKMTLFVVYFRENGNLKQSYDVEDASLFASAKDGDTFSVTVDPKNWGKGDEANKFHGVTVAKKASEKGNQAWAITGTMYGWTTEPTQSEKFIWNKGTSRYEYSTYLRSNSEFKFINAPSGDFTKDTTNEAINWKAYEDLSGNGITTYLEDGDPDPLKTDSNIKVKTNFLLMKTLRILKLKQLH